MKKIILGYNEFDENKMTQRNPNGYLSMDAYNKVNSVNLTTFTDYFTGLFMHSNLFEFRDINNINKEENYIYPMWVTTDSVLFIPEKVLGDIKNGKCIIMLNSIHETAFYNYAFFIASLLYGKYKIPYESMFLFNGGRLSETIPKPIKTIDANCFESWYNFKLEEKLEEEIKNDIKEKRIRKYKFNCLNRVCKLHRAYLAYSLYDIARNDDVLYTFSSYAYDHFRTTEEIKNMLWYDCKINDEERLNQFLSSIPWIYDLNVVTPEFDSTAIKYDIYKNSYLSVITESTYYDIDGLAFITEKTFKTMRMYQPFIMVGPSENLLQLKKWGYETFEEIIDERYAEVKDPQIRLDLIINEIRKWYSYKHSELSKKILLVYDKLEHNARNLEYRASKKDMEIYKLLMKEIYRTEA